MSCKAWRAELPCKGLISKWFTLCPPNFAAFWITGPNTGFSLKMASESCDPPPFRAGRGGGVVCREGSTKAESREEMDADLLSAKLVSQPQVKPHLQHPSGRHMPPDSPSCHHARVPVAVPSLKLHQCTYPSASKGHHSRKNSGSGVFGTW